MHSPTLTDQPMKIYLCGHGNHRIQDNGFFTLPRGTSVTIYTLAGKLMHQKDVQNIVSGRAGMEPMRVISAFGACPNLTLSIDDDNDKKATEKAFLLNPDQAGSRLFFVNDVKKPAHEDDEPSMTLKEIVDLFPGSDFVWTCCYNITFKNLTPLGARYGVNVIQYVPGGDMHAAKVRTANRIESERRLENFEINRGDAIFRARALMTRFDPTAKVPTNKQAQAFLDKLDSPAGLPSRRK